MKKVCFLMIVVLFTMMGTVSAQETATPAENTQAADQNQEAGKYARKSVSFINALWLLDASTRSLKPEQVEYMLKKVQEGISMKRFDYNPLPQDMIKSFVDKANSRDKLTIDDVASLMEQELAPKILKILEIEREMRATNLLTEQQKNSFISDKAKESGVTGEQLEKIMNSAFLYLPVISDYVLLESGSGDNQSWKCMAQTGILWYSLSTKGDNPKITLRVKKSTLTFGLARKKSVGASLVTGGGVKGYAIDGETVTPQEFAFRSMVKAGVKNLVVATQEIPEFNLSGQVVEVSGGKIGFDVGKEEGLTIDDKYKIMVMSEGADGSIKEERQGWVLTSFVADSNSKEGYKSKAKIIGGSAGLGNVLREYPRLPIDILVGFKTFPVKADYAAGINDTLKIESAGMGLDLLALYNIGRHFGISQLFLGFGWGFGTGKATGSFYIYDIKDIQMQSFEVPLMKRFYLGRLGVDAEAAVTIQQCTFDLVSIGITNYSLANNTTGLSAGAKVEYALTPSLNINAGALFQLNGENKEWTELQDGKATNSVVNYAPVNHSGLSIRAGLTWSPPALPFDPWEMLRGSMGW